VQVYPHSAGEIFGVFVKVERGFVLLLKPCRRCAVAQEDGHVPGRPDVALIAYLRLAECRTDLRVRQHQSSTFLRATERDEFIHGR
jgi:hypothetical protein